MIINKILGNKILIPILMFGKSGGLRVLSQLSNHWTANGFEVTFCSNYRSPSPYYPISANIIWLDDNGNVTESNVIADPKNTAYKRIISLYYYLRRHSKKYDIVLANQNNTAISVFWGSKAHNYYYIQAYEPEFYNIIGISSTIKKFIAWTTYFYPMKKIVNADIYKKYKNIRSKYVIPPGLNLQTYYPKNLKKENKIELIIGCIGRHEVFKGSEDVGEAVRILHERGYNVKLKVAFNPISYKNHELVIPDGDSNLADYYRSLDVLIAPGHIQLGAIHYPVIEAMACNVPVITTGYYPANNENSFIVQIKKPNEIADVLIRLINDYSVAYTKATMAIKDIQRFDWKIISNDFIKIFDNELSK